MSQQIRDIQFYKADKSQFIDFEAKVERLFVQNDEYLNFKDMVMSFEGKNNKSYSWTEQQISDLKRSSELLSNSFMKRNESQDQLWIFNQNNLYEIQLKFNEVED